MDYEIIFLDVDGTLLAPRNYCPEENIQAIRKLTKAGKKWVLASGRNAAALLNIANEIIGVQAECAYSLCLNGGHIINNHTGETLFTGSIPLHVVDTIFKVCREVGASTHCYAANKIFFPKRDAAMEFFDQIMEANLEVLPNGDVSYIDETPVKVIIIGDMQSETDEDMEREHQRLLKLKEKFIPLVGDEVNVEFSSRNCLEFTPKGISKGTGIQILAEHLQIDMDKVIAMGDGENDLAMLKTAGLGIATANALPIVKETADAVTKRKCEEGAVAEVIEQYFFNQ